MSAFKRLSACVCGAALCCSAPVLAQTDGALAILAPWTGRHGGFPPLDRIKVEDFKPALEVAMALKRREIAAITGNPALPTFANTLLPLERSERALDRATNLYYLWSSSLNTASFQAVQQDMAPRLAAFWDEIDQNSALFKRIDAVYTGPQYTRLRPEQQRLVWAHHTNAIKYGARLSPAQKPQVVAINQQLILLETRFSDNLRADEQQHLLVINDAADLAGLSAADIDGAAAQAEQRGLPGRWVFANTRSAIEPFLTRSSQRHWRERAWRMWTRRGDNGDAHDNQQIVQKILALRAQRAALFGFPSYAHWKLSDSMAREPQAALDLMLKIWQPATAAFRRDVAEMQRLVDAEQGGFAIAPWDYRFYAEKLRQAHHDFDLDDITPYLQLDRLREALFMTAKRLYGLRFQPLSGLPVWAADVSVYEVLGADGRRVGLWYFDPYSRAGKNSGAWMRSFRAQENFDGPVTAIVSNTANFVSGKAGEPVTVSWDDARTLFHEFGHALHALVSSVPYPTLSGTRTLSDFGEFPALLHEHWLSTPAVLAMLVDAAGRPLPQPLVDKLHRTGTFNQGFKQAELLATGIVDMNLHLDAKGVADPVGLENTLLAELGMPVQMVARHRVPHFGHGFSGEGYAAGYYNYVWAAVLNHDTWQAFVEVGNPYDKALAARLRDRITSVGNTVDPGEAFRNFRGRDPRVDALLRAYGFPTPP